MENETLALAAEIVSATNARAVANRRAAFAAIQAARLAYEKACAAYDQVCEAAEAAEISASLVYQAAYRAAQIEAAR